VESEACAEMRRWGKAGGYAINGHASATKKSNSRPACRRQIRVALAGELDCLGLATRSRRRFRNVAPAERVPGDLNLVVSSCSQATSFSAVTPLLLKSPALGALTPPKRRIKRPALRAGCAFSIFSKEAGVFQQFVKTPPPPRKKATGGRGDFKEKIIMNTQPIWPSVTVEETVITPNARERLNPEDVAAALGLHAWHDWKDWADGEVMQREVAVYEGNTVVRGYHDRNGTKFWIITAPDRSTNTVFLAEDY
jgi:hypothetical protein